MRPEETVDVIRAKRQGTCDASAVVEMKTSPYGAGLRVIPVKQEDESVESRDQMFRRKSI